MVETCTIAAPVTPESSRAQPGRVYGVALSLAALALIVQIPFLGRGVSFLDEGSILAIADGIRRGEDLYADRITPLAPLTYEMLAVAFRVFGTDLAVARWFQAAVFTGCVVLVWAILRQRVGERIAVGTAVAMLALKPLGFPLWTIVNYSQLAMLACLASLYALVRYVEGTRGPWLAVSGLCIGLTILTKQNLGAIAALVAGLTVLAHEGWTRTALRAVLALSVAAGVPVIATLVLFAARGTLDDLIARAVVGLAYLTDPYFVPLPDPGPWAFDAETLASRLFAYFPSPLFDLTVEGVLPTTAWAFWLPIEGFVKLAFYLPLLLFAAGGRALLRQIRSGSPAASRSISVGVLSFAVLAWGSMLYRADWSHLANIYPTVLLLAALVTADTTRAGSWGRRIAAVLLSIWLLSGLAMTGAILHAYGSPVRTPRGTVLALPSQARQLEVVLGWIDRQPTGADLAFLPAEPLIPFLAGRPLPLPFDLLVPGYLAAGDDRRIAERLLALDGVVFNPKRIPTMATPITLYAPASSEVLARRFHLARALTASAYLLVPSPPAETERVARELSDLGPNATPPRKGPAGVLRAGTWLVYRVYEGVVAPGRGACVAFGHEARRGEVLVATPMLDPATWAWVAPGSLRVRFSARARRPDGSELALYESVLGPSPPRPVRMSLESVAGEPVELLLCAQGAGSAGSGPRLAAAWAEPRVVSPTSAGQRPSAAWPSAKR